MAHTDVQCTDDAALAPTQPQSDVSSSRPQALPLPQSPGPLAQSLSPSQSSAPSQPQVCPSPPSSGLAAPSPFRLQSSDPECGEQLPKEAHLLSIDKGPQSSRPAPQDLREAQPQSNGKGPPSSKPRKKLETPPLEPDEVPASQWRSLFEVLNLQIFLKALPKIPSEACECPMDGNCGEECLARQMYYECDSTKCKRPRCTNRYG